MSIRFSIVRKTSGHASPYIWQLASAFDRALALDSKLSPFVTFMQGMSGRHYRYFINNLVMDIAAPRYLEVGSWRGSTACAAMDGNTVRVRCIDNWSEFDGPKQIFTANIDQVLTDSIDFALIERDFRAVDFSSLGQSNIYLFDGPHDRQDQYDGLAMALPALDDDFVFIVDDWNFARVRQGTFDAIDALGIETLSSIEVRTTQDDSMCECMCELGDWHNGYLLSVLRKRA